jgi:hypothetical protein
LHRHELSAGGDSRLEEPSRFFFVHPVFTLGDRIDYTGTETIFLPISALIHRILKGQQVPSWLGARALKIRSAGDCFTWKPG